MVGKTNCGKATFVQKLGINNFFSKLLKVELISCIQLSKNREAVKYKPVFPVLLSFIILEIWKF